MIVTPRLIIRTYIAMVGGALTAMLLAAVLHSQFGWFDGFWRFIGTASQR